MEFEVILKNLEDLAKLLEKGDLPIEKSLEIYKKSIHLIKQAEDKINTIQGQIETLASDKDITQH